jgi:hypothetical protein
MRSDISCSGVAFGGNDRNITRDAPLSPGMTKQIGERSIAGSATALYGVSAPLPVVSRDTPAGPVAQWLEPAAHNGLVAGSSPAGPTSKISNLSGAISP